MNAPSRLSSRNGLLSRAWVWLACLLLAAQGAVPAVASQAEIRQTPSGIFALRFVREHRAILQARFAPAAHVTQERASFKDQRAGDGGNAPFLSAPVPGFAPPSAPGRAWRTVSAAEHGSGNAPQAYRARAPPRDA
ncbi:hypothetical protein [Sphingobium boeckii]|uniref:Uncharacterized protein n=1 Tax=Sphingobium boeckii TaxID=1082345 RepID=A0A7W9AEZ9_9SPHN|nr:hypothetical protein [Sphingobium boeckii]MBB5684419.1 hypothetical protein [Sphingobium boeckii]